MTAQPAEPTTEPERPPKKPPRVVVTFRMAGTGKAAAQKVAEAAGYANYTEWIRDLVAAEATNPKHNLHPKPKGNR